MHCGKLEIRNGSIVIAVLLGVVLVFSTFMTMAYPNDWLSKYMEDAVTYSEPYEDVEILNIINQGMVGLDESHQQSLSVFTDDDFLNVARGTDEGLIIVGGLSVDEESAANALLFNVISNNRNGFANGNSGDLVFGWWPKKTPPTPVPPTPDCPKKKGTCTPGQVTCMEWELPQQLGACEYTCSPGGKWVPSLLCPTAWCHGTKCA